MENYSKVSNNNDLKELKAELAELLEEEAKADKLRHFPNINNQFILYADIDIIKDESQSQYLYQGLSHIGAGQKNHR